MEPNTAEEFDTLPHVILTQGGEWDPTVLDHILTDDDDRVSEAKREEDQEHDSPFDNRGEHKHREPVRAGVPIENPTGPPSKDPDDIEVNFHNGDIEVNFHADNATKQVHQAYQEASNLNMIYVYEGEGMPDDEVETVEEEEDEVKEDIGDQAETSQLLHVLKAISTCACRKYQEDICCYDSEHSFYCVWAQSKPNSQVSKSCTQHSPKKGGSSN
mgnify:CR=1 FL=1